MLDSAKPLQFNLERMLALTLELRKHDEQFPAQRLIVFILVALNPQQEQAEIAQRMGSTQTSVSRNLKWLREHGWLKAKPREDNGRILDNILTPKGLQFAKSLTDCIETQKGA